MEKENVGGFTPTLSVPQVFYGLRGPVRSQVRPGSRVGGSFSPGSMVTSRGLRTSPPRGSLSSYSPGLSAISPGFCLLAMIGLLRFTVANLRTGWGPESLGGRGGRGGFGTGGAGGRGRPGGAGGFGSGLLGGGAGSGIRGIRSLITLAPARRPPSWRTLQVETYHPCQAEYAALASLASASSSRQCNEPSRNFPFLGLCRPFRRVPWFTSHGILQLMRLAVSCLCTADVLRLHSVAYERWQHLLARLDGRLSRLTWIPHYDNIPLHESTSFQSHS